MTEKRVTETGFRKAGMVQLHGADVVLAVKGATSGIYDMPGISGRRYRVPGADLARLFAHLGIEVFPYQDSFQGKRTLDRLEHFEPEIYVAPYEADDIAALWVKAKQANMLEVVAKYKCEDDEWTDHFSYSGSFTVWWNDEGEDRSDATAIQPTLTSGTHVL